MSKGRLLITGGTGSFGNAYLSQAIKHNLFSEIIIFSRDEKKQNDQRKLLSNDKVKFYIGDIRDQDSVNNVVKNVDYIFHAAALKQVPSCEFFPIEALKINVLGTNNLLKAAEQNNVKKVIVLSTDKAAYPINAMGMTKALMEKVVVANSRNISELEFWGVVRLLSIDKSPFWTKIFLIKRNFLEFKIELISAVDYGLEVRTNRMFLEFNNFIR